MEEPNGAKKNLSRCSSAPFAQVFPAISREKPEQIVGLLVCSGFCDGGVWSRMHSTLPQLLLLCSTKGAFSMHALVVCQLDWVVRSWRLVFSHPARQNARATAAAAAG